MDVDVVAGQVAPYVSAAVGAYGVAVLSRVEDAAAGETVRLGQRLLARLLSRDEHRARIGQAVADLAAAPGDPDFQAVLHTQVKIVLRGDAELAGELAALLPVAEAVSASGQGAVAVGEDNHGIVSTGSGAENLRLSAGGDIVITARTGGVAAAVIHGTVTVNPPVPDPS